MHMPSVHHAVAGRRETDSFHLIAFKGCQAGIVEPTINNAIRVEILFCSNSAL